MTKTAPEWEVLVTGEVVAVVEEASVVGAVIVAEGSFHSLNYFYSFIHDNFYSSQ